MALISPLASRPAESAGGRLASQGAFMARCREHSRASRDLSLAVRFGKTRDQPACSHTALCGLAVAGADVTFSNWNQLVTAIAQLDERAGEVTTGDLIEELRALSTPEEAEHLSEPSSVWTVGNLRFTIEQEQA